MRVVTSGLPASRWWREHPLVRRILRRRDLVTRRKRQVLELVAAGGANKEIAAQLGVTRWAIEKHVRGLLRHYGARNRASLVRAAIRRGDLV